MGGTCTKPIRVIPVGPADDEPIDIECAICLDDCAGTVDHCVTRCGHHYHANCLADWAVFKRECPICRTSLDEPAPPPLSPRRRRRRRRRSDGYELRRQLRLERQLAEERFMRQEIMRIRADGYHY